MGQCRGWAVDASFLGMELLRTALAFISTASLRSKQGSSSSPEPAAETAVPIRNTSHPPFAELDYTNANVTQELPLLTHSHKRRYLSFPF